MKCKYCETPMHYVGINDGGGDYGNSVCDEFECPDCGHIEEKNCIEVSEEFLPGFDTEQLPPVRRQWD